MAPSSSSGALGSSGDSDKMAGWHWALVSLEWLAEPGSCPAGQATLPYHHPRLAWPFPESGLCVGASATRGFSDKAPASVYPIVNSLYTNSLGLRQPSEIPALVIVPLLLYLIIFFSQMRSVS